MGKKKKSDIPDFAAKPAPGKTKATPGAKPGAATIQSKQTVTPKTTSARSGHR